jgi:hypothetical protein
MSLPPGFRYLKQVLESDRAQRWIPKVSIRVNMTGTGYYMHMDGQRYRCQVIEEAQTQVKVRLSEQAAKELRLSEELWLPKLYVRVETE